MYHTADFTTRKISLSRSLLSMASAYPCLCVLTMVWTVSDAAFWLQRRRCLMRFYGWVASWIASLLFWSDCEEGKEAHLVVATHFVSYQNLSLQSMVDGWETSVCVASCWFGSSAQQCISMINFIRYWYQQQARVIPGLLLGGTVGESWHGSVRHCPVLGDAGLPPLLFKLAYWAANALSVWRCSLTLC